MRSWDEGRRAVEGVDVLIMNVRSYTFPMAKRSVKGVDYKWYWQLIAGKFDDEVNAGLSDYAAKQRRAIHASQVVKA